MRIPFAAVFIHQQTESVSDGENGKVRQTTPRGVLGCLERSFGHHQPSAGRCRADEFLGICLTVSIMMHMIHVIQSVIDGYKK